MIESIEYVRIASYGTYESDLFRFYVYDQLQWKRSMIIDELNPSVYYQLGVL